MPEFNLHALIGIIPTVLVADTGSPLCLSFRNTDKKKCKGYDPKWKGPGIKEALHNGIGVVSSRIDYLHNRLHSAAASSETYEKSSGNTIFRGRQ
jgi:hypothetical protein